MINIFKLIRAHRILLLIIVMYCLRYNIVIPIYSHYTCTPILSEIQFLFLVITLGMITAAGFVINDYFDRKADFINNPKSTILGIKTKRANAILIHSIINIIAIICGFALAYSVDSWLIGFTFIAFSFLIWIYSAKLKKRLFIDNITVSILVALLPLSVLMFEFISANHQNIEIINDQYYALKYTGIIILSISIFTFLIHLIYNLIKDIIDYRGQYKSNYKSLPISLGIKNTKYFIVFLSLLSIVTILCSYFYYFKNIELFIDSKFILLVIIICVNVPILASLILVLVGRKNKTYTIAKNLLFISLIIVLIATFVLK